MANVTFKAALNAAKFPLLYATAGTEVLDPGADVAPRVNPAFAGGVGNVDWNLIQPQYVQNMLPTEKGYRSVDVKPVPTAWAGGGDLTVESLGVLRPDNSLLLSYVIGTLTGATHELYQFGLGGANLRFTFPAGTIGRDASFSSANGRNFIGAVGTPYNIIERAAVGTFAAAVASYPAGFNPDTILGLCGSGNYQIAYTATEILWSTPNDPLDFATVNLGAGRQIPNDLMGAIVRCAPISGGFIIYTAKNAVAAYATNNPSTPFRFVAVKEAAGILNYTCVAGDANASAHYVLHGTGFQSVSLAKAEYIYGAAAEHSSIGRHTVITGPTSLPGELVLKPLLLPDTANESQLMLVAQRYLVVSVAGPASTTTAIKNYDILVVDTALNRWTRLRAIGTVAGVVEAEALPSPNTAAFLTNCMVVPSQLSATVFPQRFVVQKDYLEVLTGPESTLIVGRMQVRRARNITITVVEVFGSYSPQAITNGNQDPVTTPRCTLLTSETGALREIATEFTLVESTPGYWRFEGRVSAKNADVMLTGRWEITNILVTAQNHGIR